MWTSNRIQFFGEVDLSSVLSGLLHRNEWSSISGILNKEIEGHWLNDAPYGVVHRVVSAHIVKGACKFILNWAYSQIPNLKMDTGIKNIPMQNLLESCGFKQCGKIVNTQGITCLAYQKGDTNEI